MMEDGQAVETQQEPVEAQNGAAQGDTLTPPQDGAPEAPTEAREELPEPHVPWGKFRSVQTEFTRFRRQAEQERAQWQAQLQELQRELEALRKVKEDYSILESLLDENPEVAEQLYMAAKSSAPRGQTASGPTSEVAALANELRELKQMIQQDRQQQLMRREMERDREIGEQLDRTLTSLLAKSGMDSAWLPHVRGYVLERARALPGLELEDVPYLFAEWRKPMRELLNRQVEAWRRGKAEDQVTLPPVAGSAQPVGPKEKLGANDSRTAKVLIDILKSKGWT